MSSDEWKHKLKSLLMDLSLQAAASEKQLTTVRTLHTLCGVQFSESDFLLDLHSYVRDHKTQRTRNLLPELLPLYQTAHAVWSIDLSEKKASLLLEVLKLQAQKRPVELRGWSDEESEVKSFLQCLPYISQLSVRHVLISTPPVFLLNLLVSAAGHCSDTGQKFPEVLLSCCTDSLMHLSDDTKCKFLLDLCSCVKDNETKTGRILLPALQPLYQKGPAVWAIELSKHKASLLLEVLKLQTQKRPVELRGWSDEESEVRSLLQCLPYISQLSVYQGMEKKGYNDVQFLVNLGVAAAESDSTSGFSVSLFSACSHSSFPFLNYFDENLCYEQSDFLLDLYAHLQTHELQSTRRLVSSFLPIYQLAPAVWSIDLSERKASLLLEVLKLQTQKRPVELIEWSDEESAVRSFVQCLPYISQLRLNYQIDLYSSKACQFLVDLSVAAADSECVSATGESFSELFSSVCSYSTFPFARRDNSAQSDLLLDLYSHVMDYKSKNDRSLLSPFLPIYKLAPEVWSIHLSKTKASLLMEVLKLQTQKRMVELRGWSAEESEVRSFLQCLSHISQLRLGRLNGAVQFLVDLSVAAADSKCVSATGESFSELFSSVCSYSTFPFGRRDNSAQSDLLLDLYSHVVDYEAKHGRSLLSSFLPMYQLSPVVWSIDLSKRKASICLEVLKLQTQKRPVELRGWSAEESEVRSFVQCLPYISQLRLNYQIDLYSSKACQFLVHLSVAAAECLSATGESFSELFSSVCSYSTFPFARQDNYKQSDMLLELYSYVKSTNESKTDRKLFSAFLPVYKSGSKIWSVDLSKRKPSLLLQVLKLQTQNRPVELRGWSNKENEVRSFFRCLPCISKLSFYEGYNPQSALLDCVSVGSQQGLIQLFQTLNYTLSLEKVLPSSKCKSVGRALGWVGSKLDLTLTLDHISLRGVNLMFRTVRCLHNLRLNVTMVMRLARALRTGRHYAPIKVENLSLEINSGGQSPRVLSRVLSCLSLLLRFWTVHCLDLTSCSFESYSLIMLLSLQCNFKLRLRPRKIQKLVLLVSEVEDKEITDSLLDKVGGDLSSCTLTKEVLLSLLQHSSTNITVDYRKCDIRDQNTLELLPLLDRIQFQRPTPGFIMSIIREIYQTRSPHYVSSLLRSTENCLNLTTRVLDAADFTALHYILQHSQGVKLNLMWTSTPEGALESIVPLFSNVSQLSVDRQQLLKILHCCASSDVQQGASLALLQALQHRLDFSCSCAMDLTDDIQEIPMMHLRAEGCRVIAMVMAFSKTSKTQLTLQDCHVEEAGLEHLFWVLDKATLRCSKAQLLQFLALLSVGSEIECVRKAKYLCLALGEEVDLSHTVLDQQACGTLALLLEYSEGLSELDLSHCQLTDHCLQHLRPHLHKTTVLDLSDNDITDIGAEQIKSVVNTTGSILTVRLFNNNIVRKHLYQGDGRFELW
ncbi:uncharacterized protein LOC134437071 isoform X2 [Engraulis encrasicolus]|uniref:uncharacterized protein LOC134437071 isoform X2 n=1 Tax=Engraulis encrasicolus TaxID=184585 RepID=UPI002FD6C5DA